MYIILCIIYIFVCTHMHTCIYLFIYIYMYINYVIVFDKCFVAFNYFNFYEFL